MKFHFRHVVILCLILAASIGFGFAFDAIALKVERNRYPKPETLVPLVEELSDEYGLPEAIVWATIRNGSNFASNAVSEDGRIGLMQLSSDQLTFICEKVLHSEPIDAGLLYDPQTNVRLGCAYLSYLFGRYGVREQVYAAYAAGIDRVDAWIASHDHLSEQGVLINISDETTASYVKTMKTAVNFYTTLYSEA